VYAATHCKFEATDAASDEVVLLKILQVLRICFSCEVGAYLTDKEVWEMMETAFSMCFQMRLGNSVLN
jgi:golgi-specific brefeldin A-resistance guanine nucleotide exchange factor 1